MQAETADHWARSTVRNGYCNIDWLVAEEITQLDTGLWNDIACVSMNRKIKFLLLGFPAIMDNFAGTPVLRELKHCQLLHDLTGGWHHELTENMRSDPGIFGFLTWLRVDEPREQSLAEALQTARERFPRQGEPDGSTLGTTAAWPRRKLSRSSTPAPARRPPTCRRPCGSGPA